MATESTEPTEKPINCFRVYRDGSQALMRPPGLRGNDRLDFTFIKNLSVILILFGASSIVKIVSEGNVF